jgi:diguanylate cyclase (GGDEF)-like protein
MKTLIDGLADMTAMRDRDELDLALIKLIGQLDPVHTSKVRLIRVVGNLDDQRCLTSALLGAQQVQLERDPVWSDWSLLPALADFPKRQAAIATGQTVPADVASNATVFPICVKSGITLLLELESSQPPPHTTALLTESILRLYRNLFGLLDYGEKDALTELLNRKTFDSAFFKATTDQDVVHELNRLERRIDNAGEGYWLAVLDIDHFKRVNDNFGHLIGDEVLLLLAQLMRSSFRFQDQLYRFGGEEFVVLMRCAGHGEAVAALQRFRLQVAAHVFPQVGTITVSAGLAPLFGNDSPATVFGLADKALYYAKSHGRNQVCSYLELVQTGELEEQISGANEVDLF